MRMCHSLAFLLLALYALSAFADDVNIDCGSSSSYTDAKYELEWVGDGDYTKSGNSMTVTDSLANDRVMNTLQVFSTGKKNCYSIPSLSQEQVLVRASFYYGNYDNKSSPPTFDLLLGTNPWDTVVTSSTKTVRYEAIYVVKGSNINVCVAQTSDTHIPFMSALEIRSMSTDMYKYFDSNTALFMRDRSFFSETLSSVLDTSGRIWETKDIPSTMIMETSDATTIDGSSIRDNPPEEVLRNAVTVPKTSHQIQITTTNLPATNVPVYVTMYFSEVTLLDSTTQQRLFDVKLDDQIVTDDPIAPPYGSVYEYTMYNFTANSSTTFYLTATAESTLPPLINAFEVFIVSDALDQTETGSDNDDDTTPTPSGTTTPPTTTTTPSSTKTTPTASGATAKKKSKLPVILGTTIPAFAAFWAVVGILAIRHQKRKSAAIAAITNNMGGQGGGPNGTPMNAHGKEFVVEMGGANNHSSGEETLMNTSSGNHHSDRHDNDSD